MRGLPAGTPHFSLILEMMPYWMNARCILLHKHSANRPVKGKLMTQLIYQTDSYIQNFNAVVAALDEEKRAIILDRTAFYPGGGGQPCDHGEIRIGDTVYPVQRIKKANEQVLHFTEGDAPLPAIGSPAQCQLDWDWRHRLMRTHSALHILCGVVFRDYGASVTGGDMEPLKGRMDFEFETMQKELVAEIEAAVNAEVAKAHDIRVAILPREEAFQIPDLIRTKINLLPEGISHIRTVEIVGLDRSWGNRKQKFLGFNNFCLQCAVGKL